MFISVDVGTDAGYQDAREVARLTKILQANITDPIPALKGPSTNTWDLRTNRGLPKTIRGEEKEALSDRDGNGEMVLVVDDDRAIRELTGLTLVSHGYRVDMAVDGVEALSKFEKAGQGIDVILTDMNMPNMDGADLILAVRQLSTYVPIIACTGLRDETQIDPMLHVATILPKPYKIQCLLRALHSALQAV